MSSQGKKNRRGKAGSQPRCVAFTDGPAEQVAARFSDLFSPYGEVIAGRHVWQPKGCADRTEAKLGNTPPFLSPEQQKVVTGWWLAVPHPLSNTPNWDIVSQATILGRDGLVLIEAKAHAVELHKEEAGKPQHWLSEKRGPTEGESGNHDRISKAIGEANDGLGSNTGLPWTLSRDFCYQMSNRFAWAWKLTQLGIPVILVYLGFLNASEMDGLFTCHGDWEQAVKAHSARLFPDKVWDREWRVHGQPFIPLIRSTEITLPSMT